MDEVLKTADRLREEGYQTVLTLKKKKLGKQIAAAEEAGDYGFMVFGRDEAVKPFKTE